MVAGDHTGWNSCKKKILLTAFLIWSGILYDSDFALCSEYNNVISIETNKSSCNFVWSKKTNTFACTLAKKLTKWCSKRQSKKILTIFPNETSDEKLKCMKRIYIEDRTGYHATYLAIDIFVWHFYLDCNVDTGSSQERNSSYGLFITLNYTLLHFITDSRKGVFCHASKHLTLSCMMLAVARQKPSTHWTVKIKRWDRYLTILS